MNINYIINRHTKNSYTILYILLVNVCDILKFTKEEEKLK